MCAELSIHAHIPVHLLMGMWAKAKSFPNSTLTVLHRPVSCTEPLPNTLHGTFPVFLLNYAISVYVNLNLANSPYGNIVLYSQYFREYLVLMSSV